MIGSVSSTWERLVSMKWGMSGHVYLEWLSGKSNFGVINFFSHKNSLAALMLLLKLKLGLKTFRMHIKDVRWQAPPESFFKLNTDGSRLKNGLASAGGLVRDCSGKWQFGFGMNIGFGSLTTAELWGLFQGHNIAWNCGIRYLIAEVDSQYVSQLISSTSLMPNAHFSLIIAIKELMNRQ